MPPKNKRKTTNRSGATLEVIPIQQHLSREDINCSIQDILKRLQNSSQQNSQNLNLSVLHMIVRLCGLSDLSSQFADLHTNGQIEQYLETIAENKQKIQIKLPLILNSATKFHSEFIQRIKLFFKGLLCYQASKLLDHIRSWIGILSRSKLRNLRYAAVQVMRIFIECQTNYYTYYIKQRQFKKAVQFLKDTELYLKDITRDRLRDVDPKIRDSLNNMVIHVMLNMQNQLDQNLIQYIFQPLLTDNNSKIVEGCLNNLIFLMVKGKKIRKNIFMFIQNIKPQIEKKSNIPNYNGALALKLLIQLHKYEPFGKMLEPHNISRVFQFYSIQKFKFGLNIAVDAFYNSISIDENYFKNNKLLVMIQIMNLINNFDKQETKKIIIQQFLQNRKVQLSQLVLIDEIITIIMLQTYNHQGNMIELKQNDIITWLNILIHYAKYIKVMIKKYQMIQSQKYAEQQKKWKNIGEEFNNSLLTNIKTIIHQKLKGKTSRFYLKLIGQIIIPVSAQLGSYLDFLSQTLTHLFQVQNQPRILREIVQIIYNIKIYGPQMLLEHLNKPNQISREVKCMKKMTILNKFYVQQLVNIDQVNNTIHCFYTTSSQIVKVQCIIGLYALHNWYLNKLLSNYQNDYMVSRYKPLQKQILDFFFKLLQSRQRQDIKQNGLHSLVNILLSITNYMLHQLTDVYYELNQNQLIIIYNFLQKQIGLPQLSNINNQSKDITMFINTVTINQTANSIIKILFKIFSNNSKIATYPIVLDFILGSLIQENQLITQNNNQISSLTQTNIFVKKNQLQNIFTKQKLATKMFNKLVQEEIQLQNAQKFVFWKYFSQIMRFLKDHLVQKICSKLCSLYLKTKSNNEQKNIKIHKVLLFLMSQIDKINQQKSFKLLHILEIVVKKFSRFITKQTLFRIYQFIRSKFDSLMDIREVNNFVNMMSKISKTKNTKQQQDSDEQKEENQDQVPANRDQNQIRSRNINNTRQTRSTSKRLANV